MINDVSTGNMDDISLVNDLMSVYRMWKDAKLFPNMYNITRDLENFLKLPCFQSSSIKDINKCKSKIIVINSLTEGIHCDWSYRQYDKSKHYIIFSAGDWDKEKNDIGITSYDLLYLPWWLLECAEDIVSMSRFNFFLKKKYNFDYPKDYIFCSTIGAKRELRSKIVEQLLRKLTYENYILKYAGIDKKCPSSHLDLDFIKNDEVVDKFLLDGEKFFPKNIHEKYHYIIGKSLPIDMYNASYFNLVVETELDYQDAFFITEKTAKVLLCGMPFVVFSSPFFLKNLQNMGFRTYNTLWDESYDSVLDHNDRVNKIVELVQTLGHFDWQANRVQLQEISRHNTEISVNRNMIYDKFFENLEKVIIKNAESYNV